MFAFISEKKSGFARVPQAEDCEQLLNYDQASNDLRPTDIISCSPSWEATTIIVLFTAIMSAGLGALAAQYNRLDANAFSIRYTSQYCKPY